MKVTSSEGNKIAGVEKSIKNRFLRFVRPDLSGLTTVEMTSFQQNNMVCEKTMHVKQLFCKTDRENMKSEPEAEKKQMADQHFVAYYPPQPHLVHVLSCESSPKDSLRRNGDWGLQNGAL